MRRMVVRRPLSVDPFILFSEREIREQDGQAVIQRAGPTPGPLLFQRKTTPTRNPSSTEGLAASMH